MKTTQYLFLLLFPFIFVACSGEGSFKVDGDRVELASFQDAREGAFTVMMPKDWKVHVSLERPQGIVRTCGVATSPSGNAKIFFGDPRIPNYFLPKPSLNMYPGMNTGSNMMEVREFVSAERYFSDYVRQRYGHLADFQMEQPRPAAKYQQLIQQRANEFGMQAQISTASINFSFTEGGKTHQALINGSTLLATANEAWLADVSGYISSGDTSHLSDLLWSAAKSYQTNPEWQKAETQRNQQAMARAQAQHQQRMANRQQQFEAHQRYMQERYDAADANYQSWQQNQAIRDKSHEQFIDYIREENTITNGQYETKVQSGYNNYYVDPNTNTYIGTNSYTNPDPSIYEHWNIKR
ncbi:MAG: hypothetical protein AAF927_30015 [Bacteroidota bacterium]